MPEIQLGEKESTGGDHEKKTFSPPNDYTHADTGENTRGESTRHRKKTGISPMLLFGGERQIALKVKT